ncbi:hypothetical protein EDC14_103336 [Hydrogenispora ethanolica]|uniref:Uncharacterized protein n=1 Tax=Hydrogenispora ethanolica TaxID=1082276 RepID=A0A4R1R7D0_HYDET|nr:hypothetical protein [Hydrogenispora ethanolica]TCL61531.1 hypothetical protein EDC14_103336 [Hydrogenispora ethanolica]
MGRIWERIENQVIYGAAFYIGIAIIWILVSIGLCKVEQIQQASELKAFLESKVLLVALVFLGRYLFFPHYRPSRGRGWIIFSGFFLMFGAQAAKFMLVNGKVAWTFYLYVIADSFIWGYFLSSLAETFYLTWHHWQNHPRVAPTMFANLWQRFWSETLQTGFLLTVLLGLVYYYLVSFFVVDSLLYSYLLLVPLLGIATGLFWIVYEKARGWVDQDLFQLDQEIATYLSWQEWQADLDFPERIPWIQYLFQIRNYLSDAKRPVISVTTLFCYLLFSGFILCLPYLFGIVVEV